MTGRNLIFSVIGATALVLALVLAISAALSRVPRPSRPRETPVEAKPPAHAPVLPSPEAHKSGAEPDLSENLRSRLAAIASLQEMHAQYGNFKEAEITAALQCSRETVDAGRLIERSNASVLTPDEAVILVTELRRQGVLQQLLVQRDLQKLSRKFQ